MLRKIRLIRNRGLSSAVIPDPPPSLFLIDTHVDLNGMVLLALGSNGSGQLGIGHQDDVSTPQVCRFQGEGIHKASPLRVAGSGNTTLLLFTSGELYQAGSRYVTDEMHLGESPRKDTCFGRVDFPEACKVKMISATWNASFIVTELNDVYVNGEGLKGELGLGSDVKSIAEMVKIQGFPPKGSIIVDVHSSITHTVAVLSNGEAYGWGGGRKGQLGKPDGIVWAPRRFEGVGFEATRVVCGREFTTFFGDTSQGQLAIFGSDKWGIRSQAPSRVPNCQDIAATWGSVFVLQDTGSLHSWGRNDRKQLAPAGTPSIAFVAAGSEHVVALTRGGHLLFRGWGEHGNCGQAIDHNGDAIDSWDKADQSSVSNPERIAGIGAGCATTFFWTEESL